jgi:F420-non-reducing hydrogenase small subunit
MGGIPGLANLYTKEEIFKRVYEESESTQNPDRVRPQPEYEVKEGTLTLPAMYNDVRSLQQVIDVDYFIPGCPPQTERFVEVLTLIISGAPLPPKGSVVGALEKSLCESCMREKTENKKISGSFKRQWEIEDDHKTCLLEQGVLCMGPATRGGCGARCISANKPCGGCYGPTIECEDPGAAMISAIASMIDADDPEAIEKVVETVTDPAGTFYRFSIPNSTLRRSIK